MAQNARRHGLNVAVVDDPLLSKEAAELARAILGGLRTASVQTPLLPPPLWGRVGWGGREVATRVCHCDPHPRPLPTRGRGKNTAPAPAAELNDLARRVAEAQVDVMRVRRARHHMIAGALADSRYRSPRHLRHHIAMLGGVVDLLTRGLPVPDDMRKAAFGRPQDGGNAF